MEKSKSIAFLVIAIETLAIIVLGAFLIQSGGISGSISAEAAGKLAIDYINENYGGTNGTAVASLVKAESDSGVYKITLKFNSNEYVSYVTKNGNLFFTEGISIKPAKAKEFTKTDKPELDLFVMAFCPYGNQAETTIAPVVNLLKDKADFKLHYIFYSNYCTSMADQQIQSGTLKAEEKDKFIATCKPQYCVDEEKYCSMHGIQELNEGIREVCVAEHQSDKFWSFVKGINDGATAANVDSKWEAIATGVGIDTQKIKDCYKNELEDILKSEFDLTSKEYPVSDPTQHSGATEATIAGSPTFVLNGMLYDGSRTSEDVKTAVCSAFKTQPTECSQTLSATTTAASGSCN
jgi:hypothetical protein